MLNVISRCCVIAWIVVFCAMNSFAVDFSDENLALLDVVYQRQSVGNGLDVYLSEDSFYIPLVDLVAVLEMNINVQVDGAIGVIYGEGPPFSLEKMADQWLVNVDGVTLTVPVNAVVTHNDLIYIDKSMAEEWFGAQFELDFSNANLNLITLKSLPFADRIARNSRTPDSQGGIAAAVLPEWKQSYQWIEVPSIDARINYLSTRYEDKAITAKNINTTHYSLRTLGDFAAMSTETFLSGTRENGLAGATIRMDRYDHNRKLLGPLGFSQISIGDITNPAVGFGNSAYGRGVLVGNDIAEGGSSRDIRTIEGDYYPGWDIELYLNNALVGYQTIDETGHYAFKDVILFEGNNDFLLKFYGPSGQVDEKKRRIIVGDNVSDLRKFRYSFSVTQPNQQVIDINNSSLQESEDDSYQVSLSSRYLLTKQLGFTFGAQEASRPVLDENAVFPDPSITPDPTIDPELEDTEYRRFRYYSWGVQSYFGGLSLSLNSTTEENGATQYGANLGGALLGTLYQFRALEYDEEAAFGGKIYTEKDNPLLSAYELSLNRRWGSHSFILRGSNNQYKIGESNKGRFAYSTTLGLLGVSTALDYLKNVPLLGENDGALDEEVASVDSTSIVSERLTGITFVSLSRRDVSFRLSGTYTIKPENTFNAGSLTTTWRLDKEANLEASINHNLLTDSTFYRLGLNWTLPSFRVEPSIAYSDTGFWRGQLQVSTSLGNRTGRVGNYYRLGSDPTLTLGAIRARLFEDTNRNGRYEAGEELLSGGELHAVQARRQARSNKAGVAWLESMPSWGVTDINVNENSIDTGYMAMGRDEFSIVPRPGRVIELDLPFTRVGEIDGSVMMSDGDFSVEAKGMTVLLISSSGDVVAERTTDSQGYFNFARVKPDTYRFKVKDHILLASIPDRVIIENTGNYEPGIALTINMPALDADFDNVIENNPPANNNENKSIGPNADSTDEMDEPALEPMPTEEVFLDDTSLDTPQLNAPQIAPAIALPNANAVPKITTAEPVVPMINAISTLTVAPAVPKTERVDMAPPSNIEAMDALAQWRLQAGSFSSEIIAQRFIAQADSKGMVSLMEPVVVKGVNYYRVYLGEFSSRGDALAAKANIDAALNIQSIAVKPNLESNRSAVGQL